MTKLVMWGALLLSLSILSGAAATAQPSPRVPSLVLATIDSDHDGMLNWDEVTVSAAKKFKILDVDRDEFLNTDEVLGIMTHDEFVAADTDNDGKLSPAEYSAYAKKLFIAADKDNDDMLNAAELSTKSGVELVSLLAY